MPANPYPKFRVADPVRLGSEVSIEDSDDAEAVRSKLGTNSSAETQALIDNLDGATQTFQELAATLPTVKPTSPYTFWRDSPYILETLPELDAIELNQYALDGGLAYQPGTTYLRSLESHGDWREPRQGRGYLFDGTDDKLVGGSVTGTTIITKIGTSSLTVDTGEITATAGTLNYLALSNGSIYRCNEESGTIAYDSSGNGNDLTLTNITQSTFHATDTSLVNPANEVGYSYFNKLLSDQDVWVFGPNIGISQTTIEFDGSPAYQAARYDFSSIAEIGVSYSISFDIDSLSSEIQVFLGVNSLTSSQIGTFTEPGAYSFVKELTEGNNLLFRMLGASNTASIQNIRLAKIDSPPIIPRDESDPSNDVLGNDLQYTSKAPRPIQSSVPCLTLDGVDDYVTHGKLGKTSGTYSKVKQEIRFFANSLATYFLSSKSLGNSNSESLEIHIKADGAIRFIPKAGVFFDSPTGTVLASTWHLAVFEWDASIGTATLAFNGNAVSLSQSGDGDASTAGDFVDVDYRIGARGEDLHFIPGRFAYAILTVDDEVLVNSTFQEGSGPIVYDTSGNGNHGTLINANLANAWANTTDVVEDHCINHGGRMDGTAFVPGIPGNDNAANGLTKTLAAGKFGNPHSRLNFNPFTLPELTAINTETAYEVTDARQTVAPADTKFVQSKSDGDDKFFSSDSPLTGDDLLHANGYTT